MRMNDVGFTGTRKGMSLAQVGALNAILHDLTPKRFHHGCNGEADWQAHTIAKLRHTTRIIGHPGETTDRPDLLAEIKEQFPPKPFLERDRDIVTISNLLIAAPLGLERVRGSGTWYTIRYARKMGVPVMIIWPDGELDDVPRVE